MVNPHFEEAKRLFKEGYTPQEITAQLPLELNTVISICIVTKMKGE